LEKAAQPVTVWRSIQQKYQTITRRRLRYLLRE
jgi:hypothetical protein